MNEAHDQGGRQSERKVGRDALGLALMAVAAFTGVSAFLAVRSPRSPDGGGTAGFFVAFVGWLGGLPTLAAAAGLAWIGVRLWLGGVSDRLGRDLAGVAATCVALSALFGAVSSGLGGAVGDLLGGSVSRTLTAFVGVPFGLALLAFPVWFFWLRPRVVPAAPAFESSQPPPPVPTESRGAEPFRHEMAVTRPSRQRSEAETWNLSGAIPVRNEATSPYPPDVRRAGGIPDGARPLDSTDVRPNEPSPHRATAVSDRAPAAGERSRERARDDLAAAAEATGVVRGDVAGGDAAGDGGRSELDDAPLRAARAGGSTLAEPGEPEAGGTTVAPEEWGLEDRDDGTAEAAPDDPGSRPAAEPAITNPVPRTPPAPTWEQPSLFDDEPVDAYGTPVSVIERRHDEDAVAPPAEEPRAPDGSRSAAAVNAATMALSAPTSDRPDAAADAAAEVQGELEDDVAVDMADEAELDEPVVVRDEDERVPPEVEREVVIEPAPRRLAVDEVVYKAGCLFLDRKRVAVSMLQREFSLDFAAATSVLDQLQTLGLIGPYLGGQRRDILLTPEEWRERVGAR